MILKSFARNLNRQRKNTALSSPGKYGSEKQKPVEYSKMVNRKEANVALTRDEISAIIIKRIVKRIVLKALEPVDWITINGTHIGLDEAGNLMGEVGAKISGGSKQNGGDNIVLSQEQKQNLSAIAGKLGCEVGEPMSSDEALAGANFSWNARQLGAVNLPPRPTDAAYWEASKNPDADVAREIQKYETEYSKTLGALSAQEDKEVCQYSVNCPSTVIAYELRARGLDVTAVPVTNGRGPDVFKNEVWKGAQIQQAKDGADFIELTKNDPDTARYGVIVKNDFTKHTMVATREGGSLKIIDTQLNKTYSPEVFQATKYDWGNTNYKYTPRTEKYEVYALHNGIQGTKIFGQTMDSDTTIAFYRIDTLTIDASKVSKYVKGNK